MHSLYILYLIAPLTAAGLDQKPTGTTKMSA